MRRKLKLSCVLIAVFLPGCQLLLFLPTAPPSKAKAFIEAEILGKAYESLVPLYVIGSKNKDRIPQNIWFAAPADRDNRVTRDSIDIWEGVLDPTDPKVWPGCDVYEKIPTGIELAVVEIKWVENPAVSQFQIIVEFSEGTLYKRMPLDQCFEFGDSGVEVEDVINKASDLYRHTGSFQVRPNLRYLKEVRR